MPKKIAFGEGESRHDDLDFLFRLGQRAREKDESLGFDDALLHRVELMLSKDKFTNGDGYHQALKFANEELLPALDSEQRTKLSKARSAFLRKRSRSRIKKLDVTTLTTNYYDDIHRLTFELVGNDETIDKSSVTKVCILEATMRTMQGLLCKGHYDVEGLGEHVKEQFMASIKESINKNNK